MIAQLTAACDLLEARALIERSGLAFDDRYDELVGCYDAGRLCAAGARDGKVLKMLAVDAAYQSGPVLGELATALVSRAIGAGHDSVLVFTRPQNAPSFEALNFRLLAQQGLAALLEFGPGIERWLHSHAALRRRGINGAVVMNANPFTLGHRELALRAAGEVDHLYVFVVREDRSAFPFDARMRLVREGLADVANALVLDTGDYLVSAATFPSYFLKRDDPVARIQMELDVTLFATCIAPWFAIRRRFVGTEPGCALTNAYNETMKRLLPGLGIELTECERKTRGAQAISASRVRALLARGDVEALEALVPPSTLRYLRSDDARATLERLRDAGA